MIICHLEIKLISLMQAIKDHFPRTKADFPKYCMCLILMLEIMFLPPEKDRTRQKRMLLHLQYCMKKYFHSQDAHSSVSSKNEINSEPFVYCMSRGTPHLYLKHSDGFNKMMPFLLNSDCRTMSYPCKILLSLQCLIPSNLKESMPGVCMT